MDSYLAVFLAAGFLAAGFLAADVDLAVFLVLVAGFADVFLVVVGFAPAAFAFAVS